MTGKGARNKGLNYERKIRREFIDLGFTACNTSRYESKKVDDSKVDLCNTEPFNIQCKAVETGINYNKLLAEMPKDENYNIVLHKRNRKEIAVLSKSDFMELVEILIVNKVIKVNTVI
jgi:hypothetical protein